MFAVLLSYALVVAFLPRSGFGVLMFRRYKMSGKSSRSSFRRGQRTKPMNFRPRPMRGGTRL